MSIVTVDPFEAIAKAAEAEAQAKAEDEERRAARAEERKAQRTARALRRQGGAARGSLALLSLMGEESAEKHIESAKDWLSVQAARLQVDALEGGDNRMAARIGAILGADKTKPLEVFAACAAFGDSNFDVDKYLKGKDRED